MHIATEGWRRALFRSQKFHDFGYNAGNGFLLVPCVAMNRLEHLRRWQAEFERYRSAPLTSTERMRILWRQKRRLFRYLLSNYGSGAWRPDDGDIAPAGSDAVSALVECESPAKGKPPKDLGKIRHVLKSIHGACEAPARGPLTGGRKDCWITVAAFKTGKEALFLEALERYSIPYESVRRGKTTLVQVLHMDGDLAWNLLEEMRAEIARRRDLGRFSVAAEPMAETSPAGSRPFVLTLFFAVIWLAPTTMAFYLGTLADDLLLGQVELIPGRPGFRGVGLALGLILAAVLHVCLFSRLWNWRPLYQLDAVRLFVDRDGCSAGASGRKNLHQNP